MRAAAPNATHRKLLRADLAHNHHIKFHNFLTSIVPNGYNDFPLSECFHLPNHHIAHVAVHLVKLNGAGMNSVQTQAGHHLVSANSYQHEYIVGACDRNRNLRMVQLKVFRNVNDHSQGCAWVSEARSYAYYPYTCNTAHLWSHWTYPTETRINLAKAITEQGWNIDFLDIYGL